MVVDMIKHEVGEILRVDPEKIDARLSVYDMGLDSLMGVELVLALEARFGVRLSVMALSATPTIEKLADRMIVQLKGQSTSAQAEPAALQDDAQRQHIAMVAAQHGSEASPEVLASLARDVEINSTATNNRMIH